MMFHFNVQDCDSNNI